MTHLAYHKQRQVDLVHEQVSDDPLHPLKHGAHHVRADEDAL